jgi:precorrin-6A/cobalt-precorrin-6A reductase
MILLLGGTSDAPPMAEALAAAGYRVLVSKATDTPLGLEQNPRILRRSGPLDDQGLSDLIRRRGIRAIVDATHPYATAIRTRASQAAAAAGIPYLSFVRAPAVTAGQPGLEMAPDHAAAATAAFAHRRPGDCPDFRGHHAQHGRENGTVPFYARRAVLLTTGANHLLPYAEASRQTGTTLVVRVLGNPSSLEACSQAGIPESCVLAGRGPFSVEENRRQIRAHGIGVLVTKDSGRAGGTLEKLEAARLEGARVVVIQRPRIGSSRHFDQIEALVAELLRLVPPCEAPSDRLKSET